MDKKIASEIAVGVILLVAIIIGGIFWLQNKKSVTSDIEQVTSNQQTKPVINQQQETQTVQLKDETENRKETPEFTFGDTKNEIEYVRSEFNVIQSLSEDILDGDEPRNLSSFLKTDSGVTYKFSYKNHPDFGFWTASVVPNKPHYKNISEFENDFPVSGVGYHFFPVQVSEKYLLFISGCGGAAREDEIDKCSDIQYGVGDSIKLK